MANEPDAERSPEQRIDVSWAWSGHGERPGFRLLRRARLHPVDPDEGHVVIDSTELFRGPDEPWERVSRVRYGVGESGSTEGGQVSAALSFFHDVPGASVPVRVGLELRGESGDPTFHWIEEVTRVRHRSFDTHRERIERIEVFHAQDGLRERPAGTVTVTHRRGDADAGSTLRWEPPDAPPLEVRIGRGVLTQTRAEVRRPSEGERVVVWLGSLRLDSWSLASALLDLDEAEPGVVRRIAVATLADELAAGSDAWTRRLVVSDLAVPAGETACYTLFVEDASSPSGWVTGRGLEATPAGAPPRGFDDPTLGGLSSVQHYREKRDEDDRERNGGPASPSASRSRR